MIWGISKSRRWAWWGDSLSYICKVRRLVVLQQIFDRKNLASCIFRSSLNLKFKSTRDISSLISSAPFFSPYSWTIQLRHTAFHYLRKMWLWFSLRKNQDESFFGRRMQEDNEVVIWVFLLPSLIKLRSSSIIIW